MSDFEHDCQFCYYEYFDSRAYPCSMCIYGEERKDKFQPKGKQNKRIDKDTNVRSKELKTEQQTDCIECPDIGEYPECYDRIKYKECPRRKGE